MAEEIDINNEEQCREILRPWIESMGRWASALDPRFYDLTPQGIPYPKPYCETPYGLEDREFLERTGRLAKDRTREQKMMQGQC